MLMVQSTSKACRCTAPRAWASQTTIEVGPNGDRYTVVAIASLPSGLLVTTTSLIIACSSLCKALLNGRLLFGRPRWKKAWSGVVLVVVEVSRLDPKLASQPCFCECPSFFLTLRWLERAKRHQSYMWSQRTLLNYKITTRLLYSTVL